MRKILLGLIFGLFLVTGGFSEEYPRYFTTDDYQMTLVSNTDNCLVECEAVIDIYNPTLKDISNIEMKKVDIGIMEIPIPFTEESQMSFRFEKAKSWYNGLSDYEIYRLENISYMKEVFDYELTTVCVPIYNNKTMEKIDEYCYQTQKLIGSRIEEIWEETYVEFDYDMQKYTLKPQEKWRIKIVGYKKPTLGENNVDWIINFLDEEPPWAWWNSSYTYKREDQVNHTGSSDLSGFPYLLNGTDYVDTSTLISAGKMNSSCYDFEMLNGTEDGSLPFEFEDYGNNTYGCNSENTVVWVKSDIKADNSTSNYLYYGYDDDGALSNDTSNTWDSNFKVVSHLSTLQDSINQTLVYTNNNGAVKTDCVFGSCYDFDGVDQHLSVAPTADMQISGNFTLEAWVMLDSDADGYPVDKGDASSNFNYYIQFDTDSLGFICGFRDTDTNWQYTYDSLHNPNTGQWYYLACRYNGTHVQLFRDGEMVGTPDPATSTPDASLNDAFYIGRRGNNYWNGKIDEVRLSNIARSNEWIKRTYQYGQSMLLSEETEGGGGGDTTPPKWNDTSGYLGSLYSSIDPTDSNTLYAMGYDETALDWAWLATNESGSWQNRSDTRWVTGKVDSALDLNGDNDYGKSTTNTILPQNHSEHTVSAWFNMESLENGGAGDYPNIVSWGSQGEKNARLIQILNSGILSVSFYDYTYYTSEVISTDSWYHVVWIFNSTNQSILYLNGAELLNNLTTGVNTVLNSNNLMIGRGTYGFDNYFNGSIDEVMLWDSALNETEVNWIYERGLSGLPSNVSTTDLVGYWAMNDTFNVAKDYSSSANDVNLYNFTDTAIIDMNNAASTWTWSNFTWSNSSVSTGTVVAWKVYYNDTTGNENVTSEQTFTVDYYPNFYSITEPTDPTTYNPDNIYQFNVTVNITSGEIDTVFLEYDSSNYTMSNQSSVYYYSLPSGAGTFNYKFYANSTGDIWSSSDTNTYTVSKNSSLTLSSDRGWSIGTTTSVTITCSGSIGKTLYMDSGAVSNPYTSTFSVGTYNFTCEPTDVQNYSSTNHDLTVSLLAGCTNSNTYAFNKTITATGTLQNLDFTSLVSTNHVRGDLGDVLINNSVINDTWTNFTGGSFIVVNTTGVSSFDMFFGNYYINNAYDNHTKSENSTTISDYDELNDYYYLTFMGEETVDRYISSSANNTVSLFCPSGETTFSLNHTRILVSTTEQLDEMRYKAEYSSTDFYSRNLIVDSQKESRDFYTVDALETEVLQIILSLEDLTGQFKSSELKIKKNLESDLVTITELNFDAEDKAIVYLINGDKYTVTVDNGVEERTIGYLYADSSDLTKTVTLGLLSDVTDIQVGNVTLNLTYYGGTIRFVWNDPSNQTNLVEFWVWNYTNGSLLFSASSTNRSTVEFTYVTPAENDTYLVKYTIHHDVYGNNTFSLTDIIRGIGLETRPTTYPFPITELISKLAGSDTDKSNLWIALIFIMPLPLLFNRRFTGIAGFFAIGVIALLVYWEVFPLDETTILPVLLVIGTLTFISWIGRENR